eukprot:340714-Pyramimonas_sp.AAC.1
MGNKRTACSRSWWVTRSVSVAPSAPTASTRMQFLAPTMASTARMMGSENTDSACIKSRSAAIQWRRQITQSAVYSDKRISTGIPNGDCRVDGHIW